VKFLFENFRSYLSEEELIESRKTDAMKKYPEIAGQIERYATEDPSGNNKYLQWFAKQLYLKTQQQDLGPNEKMAQSRFLAVVIEKFHKNAKRMPKKDIMQYKSDMELKVDIDNLGPSSGEKKKKEKEKAMEGSSIIYEDDDFFIVRPDTTESSCHFGRNTKWCISATTSRNYFEDYISEGKTFYFLRNEHLSEEDDGKKLAFVYDIEGNLDEIFDATNKNIWDNEIRWHIARNMAKSRLNVDTESDEFDDMIYDKFKEFRDKMSLYATENPVSEENKSVSTAETLMEGWRNFLK